MLQCRQATYESTMADASSDMTVLDRQRSWIKQQLQQQPTSSSSSYHNTSQPDNSAFQHIASYLDGNDITNKKHDLNLSNEILGWPDVAVGSDPMLASAFVDMVGGCGNGGEIASPTSKKRKGNETRGGKVSEDKKAAARIKESGNGNGEGKENMKAAVAAASPPPKTDYIHVRARRGEATDSHSLAERVRREKISERMKYLQDLVPGCDRITGKAGMLDEIINYVQSLQRQVEFLSMKLATVHPRLDFSIDQLLSKEINLNPANSTSFPTTVGMSSSEIVDPSYLQFNHMGDAVSCCGIETTVNPSELALRRNATTLVPVPAADSCLNVHGSSFPWDNDMQNIYSVDFHQGRGFPLSFQFFQGNMMPNNPKTEL